MEPHFVAENRGVNPTFSPQCSILEQILDPLGLSGATPGRNETPFDSFWSGLRVQDFTNTYSVSQMRGSVNEPLHRRVWQHVKNDISGKRGQPAAEIRSPGACPRALLGRVSRGL